MKHYLALAALMAANLSGVAMAASSTDNMIPSYVRDAVSTNAGLEVVLPFSSINTAKTSLSLHFDVYPLASTTKLFSTAGKTFVLQTAPACAVPVDAWSEGGGHTDPVFANNFEVQMYSLTRMCSNDGSGGTWQLTDTLVYAADVSQSVGAIWTKNFPNIRGDALSVVDVNGDATPEVLIVTNPVNSKSDATMLFVNASNGNAVVGSITRSQGNANGL